MREALEGLWPENAEAWRIFQQVVTRFTADLDLAAAVLTAALAEADLDSVGDLLARLSVIYEWLYPPPTRTTSAT